jgi:hypothetical protein
MLAGGTVAIILAAAYLGFRELAPAVVGHSCPSVDTAASPEPHTDSCVVETP